MNSLQTSAVALFAAALLGAACTPATEASEESAAPAPSQQKELATELERASYLLGYNQTKNMAERTFGVLEMQAYLQGVQDQVGGQPERIAAEQAQVAMEALTAAISAKQAEAQAEAQSGGDAYRETFAKKEGVVQLPSGLLYEVIKSGDGAKPTTEDTVVTHYHGTLTDGTVFDSSVDRGEPATFPVGGVIRGWTEALQLMNTGSKWRLVIPPELAYGERGAGASIPPHATLVFEVELLEIK